ncbi:MAG: putative toxin-antitoxin system toxin component, PIN family [Chloroflexota bacterium]
MSGALNPRGRPAEVRHALIRGEFSLITSRPLLEELAEVLARPRIADKYGIRAGDIAEIVALLVGKSKIVDISGSLHLCRDPDDDVVLETVVDGGADVLVTRDEDLSRDLNLVALLEERGIRVLTVQRFLDELAGQQEHEKRGA